MAALNENAVTLISSTASCALNAAVDTEKALFTVPTGKSLIVDHVTMHTFSADCTTAVVTFGITGGTCDEFLGDQTLTGITASYATQYLVLKPVPAATPVATTILTEGQIFAMEITTQGAASTCTIDVFGHLI